MSDDVRRPSNDRLIAVMSGTARGPGPALARAALACLEPAFRAAVATRNAAYDSGLRRARRLPVPVACVGNLTTGGTGKTPVVAWLVERLAEATGRPIGVLTRGYRGGPGGLGSDEAELLAERLGDRAVLAIGGDRLDAGTAALARRPDLAAFVMDDGFQHRRLHRDFDLVLIDATNPWGFGRLLPRGLLREPVSALRRSDAVLITRADAAGTNAVRSIRAQIARVVPDLPVFGCAHRIDRFRPAGALAHESALAPPRRAFVVAGIGNPQAFAAGLGRAGVEVAATRWFEDHHAYTPAEVIGLARSARQAGAEVIVLTEKDWVKWRRVAPVAASTTAQPEPLPVLIAELSIACDPADAERLLGLVTERLACDPREKRPHGGG
jgi:tetraacyldisaccharide 4'-kinase